QRRPTQTPREFAHAAGDALRRRPGTAPAADVPARVVGLLYRARYGRQPPTEAEARDADALLQNLRDALRSGEPSGVSRRVPPPGFEVQLVAAEPYVRKPININFDDRGRLWVTESVEYPFPAGEGNRHRDAVRILEDRNGDGLADEVTTFTTGLNIPIGVLPLSRGALIYSIPYIYRFTDADGDGRADGREPLYKEFGFRDTHGMTGEFAWGFDGWVYACHGYANTSKLSAKDGSRVEMQSGNTYRFKP